MDADTFTPHLSRAQKAPSLDLSRIFRGGALRALEEAATRAIRAPGAGLRAAERVHETIVAAVAAATWACGCAGCGAWVAPEVPSDGTSENLLAMVRDHGHVAMVRLLLVLDQLGVGGPGELAGEGTDRSAWASGLGTGRKQAGDGGAWCAAAEEALGALDPEIRVELSPQDLLENYPRLREVLGVRYARALATRTALEIQGHPAGFEAHGIVFEGDPMQWMRFLKEMWGED